MAGIQPRPGDERTSTRGGRPTRRTGCATRESWRRAPTAREATLERPLPFKRTPPPADTTYDEQAVRDIRLAIDRLKAESVTIIGLCSGADNAMRAAESDSRITRMILLDPHAYGSLRATASRWATKAMDTDRWKRAASRLVAGGGVDAIPGGEGDDQTADRMPIERDAFARQLEAVLERNGQVLIRYTDFVQDILTSKAQFYAAFPDTKFGDELSVDIDAEADHTYTALAAQARLKRRLQEWLSESETVSP